MARVWVVLSLLLTAGCGDCPSSAKGMPVLHQSFELNQGETQDVRLPGGTVARIKLTGITDAVDEVNGAIRESQVLLEVDGTPVSMASGNYTLPSPVGKIQIDCPVTKGYLAKGSRKNIWGLGKDARIRVWPAGSPWIEPGTFGYPAKQVWFASATQMSNEPVYADGGDLPAKKEIYYHYGLDIGGSEGLIDVVAATDGLVVSSGKAVLEGPGREKPVEPRYDVVYLLDGRGWYYRYSHMKYIDPAIRIGVRVRLGQKLGVLGKEGGSGGWSHLHVDITRKQPSGLWGIEDGYAFLWQASQAEHPRPLTAVARPHALIWAGQEATINSSRSQGEGLVHEWTFTDGSRSSQTRFGKVYEKPGTYCEVLKVTDSAGRVDYDFQYVQVIDRARPEQPPPVLHATYAPTVGIRPDDPVVFKVRTFRDTEGGETWDFGDGSKPVTVKSDANKDQHAAMGYAETIHQYSKPGHYLVRVEHVSADGLKATARLQVRVGMD